jgi:hypothetical protein
MSIVSFHIRILVSGQYFGATKLAIRRSRRLLFPANGLILSMR